MSNLTKWEFEGRAVRTVEVFGEPHWVAKDVCEALELQGDAGQHTRRLDDDEKGLSTVQTPGGPQDMATITESGLYALIFKSRKPVAHRFRKWVTSEVLPSIRRTGGYVVEGREEEFLSRLALQEERIKQLVARVIELDSPQVLPCEAKRITRRVSAIALTRYPDGELTRIAGFRRVENELRGRLNFAVSTGHRWTSLPRHRLGDVLLALDEMEAEDASLRKAKNKHAAKQKKSEQVTLDFETEKRRRRKTETPAS